MDYLRDIDWKNDDGVFLPMLNDFRRNWFYERTLSTSVRDQECVDIGFGTGLLSLIALKHGAKHITAYESNETRYRLGQYIIQKLNLADKINLKNEEFKFYQYEQDKVYFSEIVNSSLWGENLFKVMPRQPGIKFLPNNYFLEIHAVPIPETFAARLFQSDRQHSFFDPGIDINPTFVETINELMGTTITKPKNNLGSPEHHSSTIWGGWSFLKAVQFDSGPIACYNVDTSTQLFTRTDFTGSLTSPIDFKAKFIKLQIEVDSTPTLLVPRVGFEYHGQKLFLDTAESWGPADAPIIIRDKGTVFVKHALDSGIITYSR